jgi:polysaccharide biosynthesis transport protein
VITSGPATESVPLRSAQAKSLADLPVQVAPLAAPLSAAAGTRADALNQFSPQELSLPLLLKIAATLWRRCLILGIPIGCLVGFTIWMRMPALYLASTTVQVRSEAAYILQRGKSEASGGAFVRAQVTLPNALQTALADPDIQYLLTEIPEVEQQEWLRRKVVVKTPQTPEVLQISVSHQDAVGSQALANALTRAFLLEVEKDAKAERQLRQQELVRLSHETEGRLQRLWQELQQFAQKLGSGNATALSLREEINLENYREYSHRLRQLHLEQTKLKDELQLAQKTAQVPETAAINEAELERLIQQDSRHQAIVREIVDLRERIDGYERVGTSVNNGKLSRLRALHNVAQATRNQMEQAIRETHLMERQSLVLGEATSYVARVAGQLGRLQQEEQFLTARLKDLEAAIDLAGGENGVKLEMLRHDIQREEKIANDLWNAIQACRIEQQAPPRLKLIQDAMLPPAHDLARHKQRIQWSCLGGGFSFALLALAIGFWEFRSQRIRGLADITEQAGMNVLDAMTPRRASSPIPPGIKNFAATLLSQGSLRIRRLMVTSASRGEGQEALAVLLASALARAGRKTLLMDLDFSGPTLQHRLAMPSGPAVIDLLQQLQELPAATRFQGFSFLRAGETVNDPYDLYNSSALSELLIRYAAQFEFVVLNAPPVLAAGDAALLSRHVDAAILAALQNISRTTQVRKAGEQLQRAGTPVLAVALLNACSNQEVFPKGFVSPTDGWNLGGGPHEPIEPTDSAKLTDRTDIETALESVLAEFSHEPRPW